MKSQLTASLLPAGSRALLGQHSQSFPYCICFENSKFIRMQVTAFLDGILTNCGILILGTSNKEKQRFYVM